MRRIVTVAGTAAGLLLVAAPASAFAHNRIHTPWLHALLDLLTLAVVASPVITAALWERRGRWSLVTLVTLVQLPVAVIGFVPIQNPAVHLILLPTALALTVAALWLVRPAAAHTEATVVAETR
jgi:hypothetical protein